MHFYADNSKCMLLHIYPTSDLNLCLLHAWANVEDDVCQDDESVKDFKKY